MERANSAGTQFASRSSPVAANSGAAASVPAFQSPRTKLAQWWNALSAWGSAKKWAYYSLSKVPSISPSFPCPNNEHTLRLADNFEDKPINGTSIKFGQDGYQIGQAPTVETCGLVIRHCLEAGQGLVQIVSDTTHNRKQTTKTLVEMLRAELNRSPTTKLCGFSLPFKKSFEHNYRLVGIFDHKPRGYNTQYQRQFTLVFKSRLSYIPETTVMVPVTQIGLPFEDRTLKAKDIKLASDLIANEHSRLVKGVAAHGNVIKLDMGCLTIKKNEGPLIVSKYGHGRNATVVTYQALLKRIHADELRNAGMIREALQHAIEEGRAARPNFIHSLAQVEQLEIALLNALRIHVNSKPPPTELEKLRDKKIDEATYKIQYGSLAEQREGIEFIASLYAEAQKSRMRQAATSQPE